MVIKSFLFIVVVTTILSGCASVPMGSIEEDAVRKTFSLPSQGKSGLYVYRNSNFGGALKKAIYIDGQFIGESAPMTYFYKELEPGQHIISTQSEFSNNDLELDTKSNTNYFLRNYIRIGVFVGGANLEVMPEEEGKAGVKECKLAKELHEKPKIENQGVVDH